MKTSSLTTKDIVQKWYLIDCSGKKLGRLSVQIANILRGKNKPEYTPNSDVGDFVVLINAERVEISGNKSKDKIYFKHTGYPGNLKEINFQDLLNKDPEKVLRNSVKGMLPKNRLNRKIINKLKVYSGENHPHEAQNPIQINLKTNNV